MAKYYYEGSDGELQEIELKKHKVEGFKEDNPDIELKSVYQVAKADRDAVSARLQLSEVRAKRRAEYPDVADQLDAIMKWAFTETEIQLPAELVSLAAKCMSVKSKYPLPQ